MGAKTYADGSIYEANLHYLLSTLRINALKNDGFYTDTFGKKPDKIYGLAMCYAYANQSDCFTCLSNTDKFCLESRNSTKGPNLKTVGSYGFSCLIRYSNENFFSTVDSGVMYLGGTERPNVNDTSNFPNLLNTLMDRLSVEASSSRRMLAAGYVNSTGPKRIYGLVQCTKDLSAKSCYQCLDQCVDFLKRYPKKEQDGWMGEANCYMRFSPYLCFPTELLTLLSESSSSNSQAQLSHAFGYIVVTGTVAAILLLEIIYDSNTLMV